MVISKNILIDIKNKIDYVVSKGDEMYIFKAPGPLPQDFELLNYMAYEKDSYQYCEKVDNFYEKYKVLGIYDVNIGVRYFSIEDIITQLPDSVFYQDFDAINICLAEKKVIVYRKINEIKENKISSKELFEKAKQKTFVLKHNGLEYTLKGNHLDYDSFSKMQLEELFEKYKEKECSKWTEEYYKHSRGKTLSVIKGGKNYCTLLSFLMQVEKSIFENYNKFIIIPPSEYEYYNTVKYKYENEDGFLVYEYSFEDYNSNQ